MACFVFATLKLEIPFKMSVLRPSETAWSLRYDLLCVFDLEALKLDISLEGSYEGGGTLIPLSGFSWGPHMSF